LEEPAADEFVRVEGGAAGTASLQELEELLNPNAVEKILCPRGHGRYELADCEGLQAIAGNFTVGSCSPALVFRALELAQQHGSMSTPGFNFVDVGSGPGLPLAVAAVRGGCNRVTGIELFIKRHLAAVDLMRHLELMDVLRCSVQLLRGDFLKPNLILAASLREAHAVLVNNCTYTEPFNVAMCQGPLRLMPSGSVLVTLASVIPRSNQVRFRKPIVRLGYEDLPLLDSRESCKENGVLFLDPSRSRADPLAAPRFVQICVVTVAGGLGWTNSDAFLFVYRRAGDP
jgi:hypothetical protein